jgi:hypothetical protein
LTGLGIGSEVFSTGVGATVDWSAGVGLAGTGGTGETFGSMEIGAFCSADTGTDAGRAGRPERQISRATIANTMIRTTRIHHHHKVG